jgi:hypothetical protein
MQSQPITDYAVNILTASHYDFSCLSMSPILIKQIIDFRTKNIVKTKYDIDQLKVVKFRGHDVRKFIIMSLPKELEMMRNPYDFIMCLKNCNSNKVNDDIDKICEKYYDDGKDGYIYMLCELKDVHRWNDGNDCWIKIGRTVNLKHRVVEWDYYGVGFLYKNV